MPYDALRKGRISETNRAYLVTTVTRHRHPVFTDLQACRLLVGAMRGLHDCGAVASIAWVVMPDHLHWLFQLRGEMNLGQVVATLKGRSSRTINRRLGRRGSLWQEAFHDRAIRKGENLREAARYVIANPLRAGLAESIGDYPHWDAAWL